MHIPDTWCEGCSFVRNRHMKLKLLELIQGTDAVSWLLIILAVVGIFALIWLINYRSRDLSEGDPDRLFPYASIALLFGAGYLAWKVIEDIKTQEIPGLYLITTLFLALVLLMICVHLLTLWLDRTSKYLPQTSEDHSRLKQKRRRLSFLFESFSFGSPSSSSSVL